MKTSFVSILLVILGLAFTPGLYAQEIKPITIILLRHAEKDTMKKDPPLTEKGKQRAESLKKALAVWKPDFFYSTATTRTIQTITPLATSYGRQVQTYSAAEQPAFAQLLKQLNGKTIVVVGHSNTIPQLANLILGKEAYTDMPDNEFGTIWIITITGEHASVVMKQY